jgi:probable HAF family extracellular repeat protein
MHAAYAQPRYTVTAIAQGYGEGLNSKGDVCGALYSPHHAFLYKKGKVTDLGVYVDDFTSEFLPPTYSTTGFAVNNTDFVVGNIFDTRNGDDLIDSFADVNGKIVPIADGDDDGGFASEAVAVNNSGWAVGSLGYGTTPPIVKDSPTTRGYLYRNGTTYDLGTLGGYYSEAFDINSAGQIVGSSTAVVGGLEAIPWQAFLYQNGRKKIIGGASSSHFVPLAINDNGWIAGSLYAYPVEFVIPDGGPGEVNYSVPVNGGWVSQSSVAVLYVNGRFTTIGSGTSVSMNNNGIVIGTTATGGVFVYGNGRTYDLNALVDGNWTITDVGHINDAGQIAVTGIVKGSTNGIPYALLLSPANFSAVRP